MPTGEPLPIRIVEGGERLYLYPYAIFTDGTYGKPLQHLLHFEYVHLQEFWPYWDHRQDFLGRDQCLNLAERFWYLIVRRFSAAVVEWWRHGDRWWHPVEAIGAAYRLCYPLRCSSLCPVQLGIDSQLKVEAPEGMTDTDYLVPSPAYLIGRLLRLSPCDEDYFRYQEWVLTLPAGHEIRFVVELDT